MKKFFIVVFSVLALFSTVFATGGNGDVTETGNPRGGGSEVEMLVPETRTGDAGGADVEITNPH